MKPKMRILVLCTGNRCRSQMAEGFLRHVGGDRVEVFSAGTRPRGVHPLAIRVMAETGIDLSTHTSDHLNLYLAQPFDFVITVCDSAKEACPVFPGAKKTIHQSFEDPDKAGLSEAELLPVFRKVRDQIGAWARAFVQERVA